MTLPTAETVRNEPAIWPEGQRAPTSRQFVKPPVAALVFPVDVEEPVRSAWGIQSLAGLMISLAVHGGLMLGMTLVVYEYSKEDVGSISGVLGQPASEIAADLILEAPEVQMSGGSDAPSEIENLMERLSDSHTRRITQSTLSGVGDGTGDGEGSGDDGAVAVPAVNVPSYAVTKGSFSAWTEPEDPVPGKGYLIRIAVKLPGEWENSTKYRMKDITGMVIGTDGYKQAIRFKPSQTVLVQDGAVQIDIFVPGARKLVRDTIRIESKLLKEKQVLQLVF